LKRGFDLYLFDILEAIERIEEYTYGLEFEEFENNKMIVDAVLRNLEIIGEAASQIPTEIKEKYKATPWRDIQDFRIVAAHHYWKINKERVWDIVENKLNTLSKEINSILESEDIRK
jgi:uncharacterized protein with HEPN domain